MDMMPAYLEILIMFAVLGYWAYLAQRFEKAAQSALRPAKWLVRPAPVVPFAKGAQAPFAPPLFSKFCRTKDRNILLNSCLFPRFWLFYLVVGIVGTNFAVSETRIVLRGFMDKMRVKIVGGAHRLATRIENILGDNPLGVPTWMIAIAILLIAYIVAARVGLAHMGR